MSVLALPGLANNLNPSRVWLSVGYNIKKKTAASEDQESKLLNSKQSNVNLTSRGDRAPLFRQATAATGLAVEATLHPAMMLAFTSTSACSTVFTDSADVRVTQRND